MERLKSKRLTEVLDSGRLLRHFSARHFRVPGVSSFRASALSTTTCSKRLVISRSYSSSPRQSPPAGRYAAILRHLRTFMNFKVYLFDLAYGDSVC